MGKRGRDGSIRLAIKTQRKLRRFSRNVVLTLRTLSRSVGNVCRPEGPRYTRKSKSNRESLTFRPPTSILYRVPGPMGRAEEARPFRPTESIFASLRHHRFDPSGKSSFHSHRIPAGRPNSRKDLHASLRYSAEWSFASIGIRRRLLEGRSRVERRIAQMAHRNRACRCAHENKNLRKAAAPCERPA